MNKLPAFILGNGPTLPIAHLEILADQFTIGVNRIARSGFVPTAIAYVDPSVYAEDKDGIEASGAIILTGDDRVTPAHHIRLAMVGSHEDRGNPAQLACSGNVGTACARLALSLGFGPVYLLGMTGAPAADGATNFYGVNPHHTELTQTTLAKELEALQRKYTHHIYRTDDPKVWKLGKPHSQDAWRRWLCNMLRQAGAFNA